MSVELFSLKGRRALVTGSSQGIGFALAKGLAEAGAELVLNGRDEAKLSAAAEALGGAATLAFDVTDHEAARAAVDGFEAETGPIDILINNAGMQHRTPLQDFPADAFERLLQTNIASVFHVGQAVARHMIARGGGYLLNTASAAGLLNQIGGAAYGVTKHAAVGFGEWVAITHGHEGIKVSLLCPQAVRTAMTENEGSATAAASGDGMMEPEELAEVVVEGLRDERFLILPHAEVLTYMQRKAGDYDRWIGGMNRLAQRLMAALSPQP